MIRVRILDWLSRLGRDPDRELREFKEEFYRATREKDRAALERLLHPDFTMVGPEGDMIAKRGAIAGIVSPRSDVSSEFHRAERVTIFTAGRNMVREIASVRMGGHIPGKGDLGGYYTQSAVFLRGVHGWQFFGDTLTRRSPAEGEAPVQLADEAGAAMAPEP